MRIARRLAAAASLAALAVAGLAGCSTAAAPAADSTQTAVVGDPSKADLTLTGFDGSETTLAAAPQRIVVLEYAALDTLHTLGLDELVVATPQKTLPAALASFGGEATVDAGTLKEPDLEAIASTDPDLILVGGRSVDVIPQLQEIAPTVNVATSSADMIGSAIERAEDLAGLFGLQDEAKAKTEGLQATVDRIAAKANGQTALFLLSSGGKLSAYGPGSRYGVLYEQLGFAPAAEIAADQGHGQEVSFEWVAQANPQWIFALDRDAAIGQSGQAAAAVLDNELVNSTEAAKAGHIAMLDGQSWYLVTGGLTTMQSMLDEVATAIGA